MAVSLIGRLASKVPAPVYLIVGDGGRDVARALARADGLHLVDSPRHASVLVVAGRLPGPFWEAAVTIHDQVSAPRVTVAVGQGGAALPFEAVEVDDPSALEATIVDLHRKLMTGERASEEPLGRADNPVPWQGVGPHGQGGEGMMGGKPYGRPMAMTGDDIRDGLALDPLSVPLGPFLPWLVPGLSLDLTLQGDLVQSVEPRVAALSQRDEPAPMIAALEEDVPVAAIELARARHHLEATAELLELHELGALATKTRLLAAELAPGDGSRVRELGKRLRRMGALRLATEGIGELPAELPSGARLPGPVARAAGSEEDARGEDPAYADLDFSPLRRRGGDARARWQQRLEEAAQALDLAERAGDRRRPAGPGVEGCRGPLFGELDEGEIWLEAIEQIAVGQPLDAFVTALVSLDLDAAALPPTAGIDAAAAPDPRDDEEDEEEHEH